VLNGTFNKISVISGGGQFFWRRKRRIRRKQPNCRKWLKIWIT